MSVAMNRLAARRGIKLVLAGLATLWLAACSVPDSINPVNWYRDTMGLSEDDPPEDARNTSNLAAGNTRDYPNLATVPPTPTRALSTAERDALTQRLISDRANAKYIDEQLRGGPAASAAAPPPPAPAVTASAAPAAPTPAAPTPTAPPPAPQAVPEAAVPPASAPTIAAAPPPAPPPSPASPAAPPADAPTSRIVSLSASPPNQTAAAAPAAAPTPPPAPPATAAPPTASAPRSAPWVSLSAPPPSPAEQEAAAPPPAPAAPVVDANGQPRESPLTSPTVRSIPEPETPRPAPPPPTLAQGGTSRSVAAGTQVAARTPPSAPPPPSPAAGAPIAQVTFAANSARLSPSDRRIVGQIIPLQRQTGGAVRVVGYASKDGGTASEQLANFRIALDRANAVASVLAQSGVAPDQILVETAPPTGESGVTANRAEIFLEN
jgi:outer membrane protein OmpA-like peptidoglycan-associated protein